MSENTGAPTALATDKGFSRFVFDQCAAKKMARVHFDGLFFEGQLLSLSGDTLTIAVSYDRFDQRVAYIPFSQVSALIIGK